jgi:hypothetical protein
MDMRLLWFVLAGFVLGFATSLLWEWLYFRRWRMAQTTQSATPQWSATPERYTLTREVDQRPVASPVAVEYRSPGVFLEGEQPTAPVAFDPADPDPAPQRLV